MIVQKTFKKKYWKISIVKKFKFLSYMLSINTQYYRNYDGN